METNTLKTRIEILSSIETQMDMSELNNDIQALLMKYSSGTKLQNLSVKNFKLISRLIEDIVLQPEIYTSENCDNGENNIPFKCPDCWADLEWNNNTNDVKFIKHNT